jgi:hypothetical protein
VALGEELQLTAPVVSEHDAVLQLLARHEVRSLPWKVSE